MRLDQLFSNIAFDLTSYQFNFITLGVAVIKFPAASLMTVIIDVGLELLNLSTPIA